MTLRHALLASAAIAAVAFPLEARSQERLGGFALDQLDPTPAGDTFFAVPSASAAGHLVPRAHLLYDHAFDPLVIGDGAAIVSHQAFLRADASISFYDRLLLSLDIPVAIFQTGDSFAASSQLSGIPSARAWAITAGSFGLRKTSSCA